MTTDEAIDFSARVFCYRAARLLRDLCANPEVMAKLAEEGLTINQEAILRDIAE